MIRLSESIERALNESDGLVEIEMVDEEGNQNKFIMSNKFACSNWLDFLFLRLSQDFFHLIRHMEHVLHVMVLVQKNLAEKNYVQIRRQEASKRKP